MEVYQRLGSFNLLLTPTRLCCDIDVDRIVNRVLLHCRVADKWHSVCENRLFFYFSLGFYILGVF